MKLQNNKLFLSVLSVLVLGAGVVSCGSTENNDDDKTEETEQLSFVGVTSTEWDAEVTVGSYKYKFNIDFEDNNALTFNATCTGKAASQGGGGFPGGGFPGGGFPGGSTETEPEEPDTTDYSQFSFDFTGSWEKEAGYGYILNFNDDAKTVIHTDYNKNQGRHQFYYLVTTDSGSATTLFQAKDSEFRKELASDYKTWDERDSTYIFTGKVTGNNNSVANGYIYCHKDNTAVFNTASGSDRAVTLGLKWKLENDTFTLIDDKNVQYVASNSINAAHPGYRLSYSSSAFFCSTNSSVSWSDMSNEDFDGKTLYQFTGSYTTEGPDGGTKEVELNLTNNDNKMFLYTGGVLSKQGTYKFENDIFTLSFDGEEAVTVNKGSDGKYVYSFQIKVSSFFGEQTIDVSLTYVPEA